jgi:glutamate dehydrogenase/leucine dehydrogenase
MEELGASMVGVSDASGALRHDGRIGVEALSTHLRGGGTLADFEGADAISPDELLDVECDVFIPAALGGMVHRDNADRLRCRLVVEGANSPTTPAADEILQDKGVRVVPDLMANAGGVVVSYFEWVQNLQHLRWDEQEVNDRLARIMSKAFAEVSERARSGGVPMRTAAYELGIERVVEAATTRGYIT